MKFKISSQFTIQYVFADSHLARNDIQILFTLKV